MYSHSPERRILIMALKKIQKTFYVSSETNKKLIENRIDYLSAKDNRSSSYTIESLLLKELLPKNREAKSIIEHYLYSTSGQSGVKFTLDALFSYNAAGVYWKSKYNNFKPLLEYCMKYGIDSTKITGKEPQLHHFHSQFKEIVEQIEKRTEEVIESLDREKYENKLDWSRQLLKIIESNPKSIVVKDYFELIYDCWDMLYDWSITFRCLSDLSLLGEFDESNDSKNILCDIVCELSEEW